MLEPQRRETFTRGSEGGESGSNARDLPGMKNDLIIEIRQNKELWWYNS